MQCIREKIGIICISLWLCVSPVAAAEPDILQQPVQERLEGTVTKILEEYDHIPPGQKDLQHVQKLEITVSAGSLKGKAVVVEHGIIPTSTIQTYRQGDAVVISYNKQPDRQELFFITDYVRRGTLAVLFALFVICTVAVARWRGALSLVGMGISLTVIVVFILPRIASGANPVETAIIGSFFIIPVSFLLSHGWNKKTLVAAGSTMLALFLTGILAHVFVEAAKLTGFASEEAAFLQTNTKGMINIKGLLLAGIIIGALGVLDDITVSQAGIVCELKKANAGFGFWELYKRAMRIGRDHIASMVNTLVLVYTGAALPLLLLFLDTNHGFSEIINYEIVADEIVRTLVGSIGLVLAVPVTTLLATIAVTRKWKLHKE